MTLLQKTGLDAVPTVAELERRLQASLAERDEALAQSAAMAEVLQVINAASGDPAPVLDAILAHAMRLCDAAFGMLNTYDGEKFKTAAVRGLPDKFAEFRRSNPPAYAPGTPPARLVAGEPFVHVTDITDDEPYRQGEPNLRAIVGLGGARTVLAVPLLKDAAVVGMFAIYRQQVRPFTERQIALLQSFAAQASLALQNTRLFNETREALERQTATADILKVIASSPEDVQPVFSAIAQSANRLIGGFSTAVFRFVGGIAHLTAFTPTTPEADEVLKARFPRPITEYEPFSLVHGGGPVQITDTENTTELRDIARVRGFRSMLFTPLVSGGAVIGVVSVTRKQAGSFADHHVELLRTFADQAVIAIQNVRLFNETREALQYQTATSDVLNVISRSTTDVQPVFDAIVTSASQLFAPCEITITILQDGKIHWKATASHGHPVAAYERTRVVYPVAFDPVQSPSARAMLERRIIEISDATGADTPPATKRAQAAGQFGSVTFVPLLKDGEGIGTIILTNPVVGFKLSEKQLALVKTFADQAVIAIENARLFDEVQARTAELSDSLQQQTATADVLKVISRSTFDLEAVFQTLVASAAQLCVADRGIIWLRKNDMFYASATEGFRPEQIAFLRDNPRSIHDKSLAPRVLRSGQTEHIPDRSLDPEFAFPGATDLPTSMLGVPLLRNDVVEGVFTLFRMKVAPFTSRQIELVESFADQAVIAIGNVRLFDEVQTRTRDLQESLQQQTATADVLKVISRSTFDLKAVLRTLVQSARDLCNAPQGMVLLRDGGVYRCEMQLGYRPEFEQYVRENPIQPDPYSGAGRAAFTGQVAHFPDVMADPDYRLSEGQRLGGYRALLSVPLLRESEVVGVFSLARAVPEAFTVRQIELVQSFADQAVIAIENVRLFDEVQARTAELSESLQQQTATADVLKVISRSTFDLQTVLETLIKSAVELSGAGRGSIFLRDGDVFPLKAASSTTPEFIRYWTEHPATAGRGSATSRVIASGKIEMIEDTLADPEMQMPADSLAKIRGTLGVPLLRDNKVEGVLVLTRPEPGPFSKSQIDLVQTFADQAVIAVENVRLFEEIQARTKELSESLQVQTATSEVLKVISRSPDALQPVLDVIVKTSRELCGADASTIFLLRDGKFHLTAVAGQVPLHLDAMRANPLAADDPSSVLGRMARDKRTQHYANIFDDPELRAGIGGLGGPRALLTVPLMRDGEVIGGITLRRPANQAFTPRQVEAIEAFADQAVIAISNVGLFEQVQARTAELSEALTYQTGSGNILKVIASSPTDVQPVLKAIVESASELCEADDAIVALRDGEDLVFKEHHGSIPIAWQRSPIHRAWVSGRAVVDRCPVHVPDLLAAEGAEFPESRELALRGQIRTILSVPLLREGISIGSIVLRRTEVNPFADKQIALLQTFADQAVIAISNVGLFEQVQARTAELSHSLDELRTAQDRLVQTEKLASLGQLTAGIAHEIKNPLNFVNNFAALSSELVDELKETLAPSSLDNKTRGEVDELSQMLQDNLGKVVQHGRRADSIVKNMLLHSREGSGERRPADINAIVEESLNLSYHGARAERSDFNITLRRDLDPEAGMIDLYPQEITRVFLNLISNGFYAATKRKEAGDEGFEPTLSASTRSLGNRVEIRIRDNGTGIPLEVKEKMFNPFFTTKPAGEGTGLGLSMSHDIVVKQHGGKIDVDTEPGAFTEFIITLPRNAAAQIQAGGTN